MRLGMQKDGFLDNEVDMHFEKEYIICKYLFEKGAIKMKSTGMIRKLDDLGRVVIPKEIRRTLRIREGDPLLTTLVTKSCSFRLRERSRSKTEVVSLLSDICIVQ